MKFYKGVSLVFSSDYTNDVLKKLTDAMGVDILKNLTHVYNLGIFVT